MLTIMYSNGTYIDRIVEFKYNTEDESGCKYGMVAFGHSPDGSEVDCMYAVYTMSFKVAAKLIEEPHSILWGLHAWTSTKEIKRPTYLGESKNFKNYFRLKALQGFRNEGYIEAITYVPSLAQTGDS